MAYFIPALIGVVLVGAAVITAGLEFAEWLQRRFVRKPRPSIDGFAQPTRFHTTQKDD